MFYVGSGNTEVGVRTNSWVHWGHLGSFFSCPLGKSWVSVSFVKQGSLPLHCTERVCMGKAQRKLLALLNIRHERDCSTLPCLARLQVFHATFGEDQLSDGTGGKRILLDWESKQLGSSPSSVPDLACERYQEIFYLIRGNFPLSHSVTVWGPPVC